FLASPETPCVVAEQPGDRIAEQAPEAGIAKRSGAMSRLDIDDRAVFLPSHPDGEVAAVRRVPPFICQALAGHQLGGRIEILARRFVIAAHDGNDSILVDML